MYSTFYKQFYTRENNEVRPNIQEDNKTTTNTICYLIILLLFIRKKYKEYLENQRIRDLLSLIKTYYKTDHEEKSIREVNIIHVANRVSDTIMRDHIVECWNDLQARIGYEIVLLENNYHKSFINKLCNKNKSICFAVKTRPDRIYSSTPEQMHESIKKHSIQ